MATKLFVGGLPYAVNDDDLGQFFAEYGSVASSKVITDRETGRSRGFGFVEFENEDDAKKAIDSANGAEMNGRKIVVNEAKPQERR